jgi:hypothetical protein
MSLPLDTTQNLTWWCPCAHSEASDRIKRQLDRVDELLGASKTNEAVKELKKAIQAQKAELHQHTVVHQAKYERNMVEFVKTRSINSSAAGGGGEPLQTSVWKAGDLKRLRDPVKKKRRKDTAAAATAATAAATKKPKKAHVFSAPQPVARVLFTSSFGE